MISHGWNKDLNRVTTDKEFMISNTECINPEVGMWALIFHTNDKKESLSFNGTREDFSQLCNLLNKMMYRK